MGLGVEPEVSDLNVVNSIAPEVTVSIRSEELPLVVETISTRGMFWEPGLATSRSPRPREPVRQVLVEHGFAFGSSMLSTF